MSRSLGGGDEAARIYRTGRGRCGDVAAWCARTAAGTTGDRSAAGRPEIQAKQVELLHQLVPKAPVMGFLVNPKDPNAEGDIRDAQAAASAFGQKLVVGRASTESEIDSTFATFSKDGVAALFVDAEPFLLDQREKIVALAAQRAMPVVSQFRSFAVDGGLAAYGTSLTEANRLLGVYTGRVLKGTKPADLPVVQSTKIRSGIEPQDRQDAGTYCPEQSARGMAQSRHS